ncbi:MAG TPA: type II toxin-antitoxin system VapC family toxin [Thermoanaerobaculia bacterium]|nr:type II toxin-antitoxin system VapC family toxin [Thermoanaerobaculia bacterium]
MILFLDTSALVKLYIAEPGSERMRAAAARAEPVAVSVLAFAEIHATFARRRREELLQATEFEQLPSPAIGRSSPRCPSEPRCSHMCPGSAAAIPSAAPMPFI